MKESKNEIVVYDLSAIRKRIFNIRGLHVMTDSSLAELYGVETKVLNQAVKRNQERFPTSFMFQLSKNEWEILKSQIVTSSWGGRRTLPYVFTEQGVSMLSAVLKTSVAVEVSILVVRAFVEMRKFILNNAAIFQRLEKVELSQIEADKKFEQIFSAMQRFGTETRNILRRTNF